MSRDFARGAGADRHVPVADWGQGLASEAPRDDWAAPAQGRALEPEPAPERFFGREQGEAQALVSAASPGC